MTDNLSDLVAVEVLVSGRVQGVWYRGFAEAAAADIGVSGWVRNLPDGRVQAEIEGPKDRVDQMLAHLRTGPPRAHVADVSVTWKTATGACSGFQIRH